MSGPLGEMRQTLYQHAVFNADLVEDELLELWQKRGLAEPVDTDASPLTDPAPPSDPEGGSTPPTPAPPSITNRSNKGELVAYGVSQGDDQAELQGMSVKDLQQRYLKAQQSE
ncbi:hypothetical protein OIE13_05985 [Streptosporangium sp. NBC_01810]|uniref:hypothetical protein n=1 Tax=Streptosporangium sp. NBC_01810 TaxID=2975951 RepID=UPI002DDAF77C|nr:hypothetical protein [Streptosporangium sp. NBC_01810]WSA27423.1 hypothetical protein OIE13_05985 [Streptosporangium sp. NBC_01810]